MPSSFMVKRNYANCPLKKRPLALYNETLSAPEQDQPEDLSVKRPKLDIIKPVESKLQTITEDFIPTRNNPITVYPQYNHAHNIIKDYRKPEVNSHSAPSYLRVRDFSSTLTNPSYNIIQQHSNIPSSNSFSQNTENLPSLAEYYLQLFRTTSEAEKKEVRQNETWNHHYLPPSPQASPVPLDQMGHIVYPPHIVNHQASTHIINHQPLQIYPDTSALISPVSSCSSFGSDDEEIKEPIKHSSSRAIRHHCDKCGKSYSTPSGLSKHKQLHCTALGPRVYSCKHCSKTYTSIGALKMHIRTHTLPCKCHICGKAFSRPWLLQGHVRTHTGEKPFDCPQCERSFADRSNLRAHLQTHAHIKKYACQGCHKTFSRMSLLNKHSESACSASKITSTSSPSTVPSTQFQNYEIPSTRENYIMKIEASKT